MPLKYFYYLHFPREKGTHTTPHRAKGEAPGFGQVAEEKSERKGGVSVFIDVSMERQGRAYS